MILIDMNLPKAPDEMVEIAIFGDGKVLQTGESWRSPEDGKCYYTTTNPEKHFQAVELPTHGRLIDADALYNQFMDLSFCEWNKKTGGTWADGFTESALIVEDAPTVIPADNVTDTNVGKKEET